MNTIGLLSKQNTDITIIDRLHTYIYFSFQPHLKSLVKYKFDKFLIFYVRLKSPCRNFQSVCFKNTSIDTQIYCLTQLQSI